MDRAASPDGAIDLEGRFEIKKTAGSDLGLDQEDKKKLFNKCRAKVEEGKVDVKNMMVPDYLMCRISDELMMEPVILSSGFTYEKE